MANILDFGGVRVLTSNAQPGAGYVAKFYVSGTTTPVTVYTDSTLGTAHGVSVTCDAAGIPPAVWSSGGAIKCVIEDATGAVVQTIDPVISVAGGGSSAEDITFAPTIDLPFTNVQDAIEGAAASAASGFASFGIGITGNAVLLANIDATNIGAGVYRFDGTTTGTYPTGVAAADTGLVEHWRQAGAAAMQVLYHATTDRVFHRRMASTTWGTWREVLTVNQGAAEGDTIYRGASAWTRLAKGTAGQGLIMNAAATAPEWASAYTWTAVTTNGAAVYDFGSIPAWVSDIVCTFEAVSFATTSDTSVIQIGTGGIPATTDYSGNTATVANAATPAVTLNNGSFVIGSSLDNISGALRLLRRAGSNFWVATGMVRRTATGPANAINTIAGAKDIGGTLDIVRLTRSGSGNYNGGAFAVGYR